MANPKLSVGDAAPDFTATTHDGQTLRLADLAGQRVILYFYPKDDTPGCTAEACDFRDAGAALDEAGARVIGVSPDSEKSHVKFRDKYDLPFTLLADKDKSLAETFGVFREKKNYGRTYVGIVRSTFVIDAQGKLEQVFDNVRAKGHVERVLRTL
jgi:thioredoxin-dependent peroxiredoxin